jgi:hypothetical protein
VKSAKIAAAPEKSQEFLIALAIVLSAVAQAHK